MFDRFTQDARAAMGASREAAMRLQHDVIGPEHVLLGLAVEDSGAAATVLRGLDVDLARVRRDVEAQLAYEQTALSPTQLPFTDAAKRVLEDTLDEARKLGHTHIGTEHLLLGVLRQGGGAVAQVLKDAGVDLETARIRVRALPGA